MDSNYRSSISVEQTFTNDCQLLVPPSVSISEKLIMLMILANTNRQVKKAHQYVYPVFITHLFLQIPEIRMLLLGTFHPFVDIFKCLSAVGEGQRRQLAFIQIFAF